VDGNGNRINTHYFRKTVSTPAVGGTVTLRGRVLYDDSVMIYVNGVELTRFNLPAGTITAASQGVAGHENTDSTGVFEIVVTNWVAGNNIIAAETHQNGATSSDVVFGLELTVSVPSRVIRPPNSVQIVSQPQSRSVGTNANVAFSVGSTGDPTLTYQWRKNGTDIPHATSASFVINNVGANDAGSYSVRVANSFSSMTSQPATLTVTNAGGGTCTNAAPTLFIDRQGTNVVLQWTNPTDSCSQVVPYILRSTTALPVPPAAGTWTTNAGSSPQIVAPTNSARFYQLIRQ
jgi:hypothetical protein